MTEEKNFKPKAHFSSVGFVNDTLALFRWVFYRPIPDISYKKRRFTFVQPLRPHCFEVIVNSPGGFTNR